jgi:predicted O-methyltransferase YrrM
MKFADIAARVGHVPFIERPNAERLYNLILKERPQRILELGIAHGTATCYMAAALEELGGGLISAVDLIAAADYFHPSAEAQLESVGLGRFAEVIRTKTGYNWFMHDNIARNTENGICQEEYDLCVIDGSKNWTSEGAAFFFADKLLKPNAWLIFDDYLWSAGWMEKAVGRTATDGISNRDLSEAEIQTSQISEVFELLVVQHPNYSNFIRDGQWAMAQKVRSDTKSYTIVERNEEVFRDVATKAVRKAQTRLLQMLNSPRR